MLANDSLRRPLLSALVIALAMSVAFTSPARAVCTDLIQFADPVHYTAASNPNQVVIGDFNEDGISDLAAAVSQLTSNNGVGAHVAVYIGTGSGGIGNGGFLPAVNYPTGNACFGIAVGDFNSDGIQDLVTSNYKSNSISVLLGNGTGGVGNGTFGTASSFPAGNGAWHVATGDFDEDGITDLAVSDNSSPTGVTILRGQGSGGVGNGVFLITAFHDLPSLPTDIQVADLDEDGILDVVTAVGYSGKIAVLKGQGSGGVGNGGFAAPQLFPAGPEPFGFAIADLDEDGILDLAVGSASIGGLQFLKGNGSGGIGNGTFASPVLIAPGNIPKPVALDVNEDGNLDLIYSLTDSYGPTPVNLVLGNGNGTFGTPQALAQGWLVTGFAVGNFDASSKLDVAYTTYLDNRVSVMLGQCQPPPPVPGPPHITKVRDVPNDQGGKLFITWTASSYDVSGGSVTSYRVWRRIPEMFALRKIADGSTTVRSRRADGAGPTAAQITYWEAAAVLPAQRLPGYGYTAGTPQDSMASGNPYTAFYITAATNSPDVFYDSPVDSGYSVDNIPPDAPQNATMTAQSSQVQITWDKGPEADLEVYQVHRGSSPGFAPSAANLVAEVETPGYTGPFTSELYYKLIAVDKHGNNSSPTLASLGSPTGVAPGGFTFALDGVTPHPARSGAFAIRFRLADHERASLEILDVRGRRVVESRVDPLGPGEHVFDVSRTQRLPAGVYLVRLVSGTRIATAKAVVLQ